MESLAKLPTVFKKDGVVTAGSASGICDGAAAILLASESAASKHNLKPLARLVAYSSVGVPPEIMGFGPVPAIQNVLKAANLTMDDIDLIEVNYAQKEKNFEFSTDFSSRLVSLIMLPFSRSTKHSVFKHLPVPKF